MKQFLFSIFFVLLFCGFCLAQNENQNQNSTCNCAVQIKVEFLDSGKIGETSLVSSSCNDKSLEQQALDAAKKIDFKPAVKSGKTATVTKNVGYTFNCTGDEKAEAVLNKAVQVLGGDNYLKVRSQIGRGKFSSMREGVVSSFQTFIDVIVFPDKERTEFKAFGVKTVQTNTGDSGWIFDGEAGVINVQSEMQVNDFKRGINASLDNLLRGAWRGKAALSYVGKREATLGKRNDVIKLTYDDDFAVEFEFSADGFPVKAIYKRTNPEGEDQKEEDRYAQFVDIQGIKTPFIIDHFSGKVQTSRINYETVEFNKSIPDSIFAKPTSPKEMKKDLKL